MATGMLKAIEVFNHPVGKEEKKKKGLQNPTKIPIRNTMYRFIPMNQIVNCIIYCVEVAEPSHEMSKCKFLRSNLVILVGCPATISCVNKELLL